MWVKMFSCIKRPNRFIYFISTIIGENQRLLNTVKPFAFFENCAQIRLYRLMESKDFLITNYRCRISVVRNKSQSKKIPYNKRVEYESSDDDDEDDDDDDDEEKSEFNDKNSDLGKDVEVVTCSLKSMRTDLILKTILRINRKKVEEFFYQNKIRINGKLVYKKALNAKVGDEIDMIYGTDNFKLNTLKIGRVKIVKAEEDPDKDRVIIKVLKSKSLIINNSSYQDVWKEPINED